MKQLRIISFVVIFSVELLSNGLVRLNNINQNLKLLSSNIDVVIQTQIAVTKVNNRFKNEISSGNVTYAFPLPNEASATNLRWKVNGLWYTAQIIAQPQDTTFPGGALPQNIKQYLGETPLFFSIPQNVLVDSILEVELTYVELLKYKFGEVKFNFPNNYGLIQTAILSLQSISLNLYSSRTIDTFYSASSHTLSSSSNTGNHASLLISLENLPANENYKVVYRLNSSQLGLFSFSTFIDDTLVVDSLGRGFFTFIAEPNPTSSQTINKVFTLIVDKSGSMSGQKIIDAKNAAKFIVENLNEGDKFNIISFDQNILSFMAQHVPFNHDTKVAAVNYITLLIAGGSTNISGAFGTAIPQFATSNDSTANIIIFFTDGQATAGITSTNGLVDYVTNLINQNESRISIFCFGIGNDVNKQLLTLLSSRNRGFAEFLEDDELYQRITEFYLSIRNPVLLNTQVQFQPPIVSETYPDSLPNLYKGTQMILSGRYTVPGTTAVNLSGEIFGQPVNYNYNISLTDSMIIENQFLTKIWAKLKIESLLVKYYALDPNSPQANALKEIITTISLKYGVISPFTSFSGGYTSVDEIFDQKDNEDLLPSFELLGNYPNPFNPSTRIKIKVNSDYIGYLEIKIYSISGELIQILTVYVSGQGIYELTWNGKTVSKNDASSGIYIYVINVDNYVLAKPMLLLK